MTVPEEPLNPLHRFPRLSAAEAASLIGNGETLALGGFTTTGVPRAVATALAERATGEHAAGRPFQVGLIGVATGPTIDGVLSSAGAIASRTPWQCDPTMRAAINRSEVKFWDMHISDVTQELRYGSLGSLDWAIVDATELSPDGEVLLTSAVGPVPTITNVAKRVLIELNRHHPPELRGIHDVYEAGGPPHRREVPVYCVSDRAGTTVLRIDPAKIAGVIETNMPDPGTAFEPLRETGLAIGRHLTEFLARELTAGRIPKEFLPVQSGVGDTANAVLTALGEHPAIPPFEMYTEVIQDAIIPLMENGRLRFASCCAFTMSPGALEHIYSNLPWFRQRIVLRSMELSNHPEVIRRLGVISMNTALEADLSGNVNSTYLAGRYFMNGIGGSADFTRNAYLSVFSCASTAKGGKVSTIVPLVSHVDHTEHSVDVLATEWGVADLRGLSPRERANTIIRQCAHPDYRDLLTAYIKLSGTTHAPHTLRRAFAFHEALEDTGDMRAAKL